MEFKKVSQIIWMILAALFIAALFLRVYTEAIYIKGYEKSCLKINKITGRVYGLDWGEGGFRKWVRIEPR